MVTIFYSKLWIFCVELTFTLVVQSFINVNIAVNLFKYCLFSLSVIIYVYCILNFCHFAIAFNLLDNFRTRESVITSILRFRVFARIERIRFTRTRGGASNSVKIGENRFRFRFFELTRSGLVLTLFVEGDTSPWLRATEGEEKEKNREKEREKEKLGHPLLNSRPFLEETEETESETRRRWRWERRRKPTVGWLVARLRPFSRFSRLDSDERRRFTAEGRSFGVDEEGTGDEFFSTFLATTHCMLLFLS